MSLPLPSIWCYTEPKSNMLREAAGKGVSMKLLKRWFMVLLVTALLPAGAVRAEVFSVRRADGTGGESSSVKLATGGNWALFLPAYMRGQPLELTMTGREKLSLKKKTYTTGDVVTLNQGDKVTVIHGELKTNVIVMERDLPALHLTLRSGGLARVQADKNNKEPASLAAYAPDGETLWEGELKNMKGHGNASFQFKKKSYQIQFKKKTGILGLSSQKKFILLANQHENSLMRNRITFDLARAAGLAYTPRGVSVDLFANGEYLGNYLLCGKITVSSGSVDIEDADDLIEEANPELFERDAVPEAYGPWRSTPGTFKGISWPEEPEDITGGYLFQLDYDKRYVDDESGVVTKRGQTIVVKSPEYMTPAQGEYLNDRLNSFERAIFAADGRDPDTGRHYTELADMTSLVRKYMIEEISKNYDGNKSSQFFYKDSDEVDPLIYAGPVWDYDSAWGNYAGEGRLDIAAPKGLTVGGIMSGHAWWPALYHKEDFKQAVCETWRDVYRPLLLVLIGEIAPWDGCGVRPIAEIASELEASAQMNFRRWNILNAENRAVKTGATYAENIDYLTEWIRRRIDYLDTQWAQP